jgi:hypothetical protein
MLPSFKSILRPSYPRDGGTGRSGSGDYGTSFFFRYVFSFSLAEVAQQDQGLLESVTILSLTKYFLSKL